MRAHPPAAPLQFALAVLMLVAAAAVIGLSPPIRSTVSVVLLGLISLAFLPDALDILVRVYGRRSAARRGALEAGPSAELDIGSFTPYQKRLHLRPFAAIASVHNLEGEIGRFVEAIEPIKDRLWVIDDASTDRTAVLLDNLGVRCERSTVNLRKPAALRALLARLPKEIETVLVLDPDTRLVTSRAEFEERLFEFQRSGMSSFTPRFAVEPDGMLSTLQSFEYCLSLGVGRKSLGDFSVNSGVAIYDRQELESALDRHSLSVYGEDLETSLILLGDGKKIYYDDRVVFETRAKTSWRELYSQRVGWSYSLARVYATHLRELWRVARRQPFAAYQYLVYLGGINFLLQPLRVLALFLVPLSLGNGVAELAGVAPSSWNWAHPSLFAVGYAAYVLVAVLGLAFGVPRGDRQRHLSVIPLYFLYVLFLIVPNTQGYLNWISIRLFGRRLYRDHFQDEASLAQEAAK